MCGARAGNGEEAYSIAIAISEALAKEENDWSVRIFATDINAETLKTAPAGMFPRERFETTKLGILDRYFEAEGAGFKVRPIIKNLVRFSRHDLTSPDTATPPDSVFGSFDLVLCRNVLIYFLTDVQNFIFGKLLHSLTQGGYLVLGDSESLGPNVKESLTVVDRAAKIFKKP